MKAIIQALKQENYPLFLFGLINLVLFLLCLILMMFTNDQVLGISSWIKPSKFFISATIYCWTMLWFLRYLPTKKANSAFSWMVILVLTFENVYIFWRASRGELSHFNTTSPTAIMLFGMMGLAIGVLTTWTLLINLQFFILRLPLLKQSYLWGIRLGLFIFVFFAFSAYIMAAKLGHTVGAPDGGEGLPYLNWSKTFGDLRIAHFMGMHALQIIPLLGFYLFKKSWQTILFSIGYFALNFWILYNALGGKSLI